MYEIRWLPDGPIEAFAGSRGNYYELSASEHLDLDSVPVWCNRCATITHGEHLSTLDEIDDQIRDLNDPTSAAYRRTRHGMLDDITGKGEEFLQKRLAKLELRRRWRQSRRSPPKCIRCGSTEIVELPIGKAVPNPFGDGEIQVECVGMCSTVFNECPRRRPHPQGFKPDLLVSS
ncbi:MAG TPA: hypothetical protein VMP01_04445 [Pirellulaceae bacterium]|nr:hypothetical protein [Pirellulaceae bacterium]